MTNVDPQIKTNPLIGVLIIQVLQSTIPHAHSLGAVGGALKETDVTSNIRMKNRNIWCPVLFYKSDATALRALGAISLIAPLFLIAYSQ